MSAGNLGAIDIANEMNKIKQKQTNTPLCAYSRQNSVCR